MASRPINILSLCSGIGMHDLGIGTAFPARTICYVEREAYAASQMVALMEAGFLDEAPIWSDLATFDARPWGGIVDTVVAGLPCQPYSPAGRRRGNDDARAIGNGDGPIVHFLRIVAECRPAVVWLENVPAWVSGGWFRPVGEELSRLGYQVEEPLFLAAEDVGASHERERVWIMAHDPRRSRRLLENARHDGLWGRPGPGETEGGRPHAETSGRSVFVVDSDDKRFVQRRPAESGEAEHDSAERAGARVCATGAELVDADSSGRRPQGDREQSPTGTDWGIVGIFAPGRSSHRWPRIIETSPWLSPAIESGLHGVVDGSAVVVAASRRHQLRAIGNGGVPLCSAVAFTALVERVLSREVKGEL
jgi:DNA (cytosine-5)-methyltransferase 1